MLIILDFGANDGCSILKFKDIIKKKNIINYKIFSFEPILFFNRYLDKLKDDNIIIINKIISTDSKNRKLYLSTQTNDGSSVFDTKITNGISNAKYILSESINIVDFINNLEKYDELWIKMDIEGGEYDIIKHMYANNILKNIDKLFIEWHYNKIKNISKDDHEYVVNLVKDIETFEWDALEYSENKIIRDKEYLEYIKNIS